jgi:uncharacterized protein YeaO (DUF488 family)
VDLWLKEIAPSNALRKWFDHDPAKWPEFLERYREELVRQPEAVERLQALARTQTITFLFAAKDERHNNAVALAQLLNQVRPGQ